MEANQASNDKHDAGRRVVESMAKAAPWVAGATAVFTSASLFFSGASVQGDAAEKENQPPAAGRELDRSEISTFPNLEGLDTSDQ